MNMNSEVEAALDDLRDIVGESIFIYVDGYNTVIDIVNNKTIRVKIKEVCVTSITFDDSKVYLNYIDEEGFLFRVDYDDHGNTFMFTREMAKENLKNQI